MAVPGEEGKTLRYLVMEFVEGVDLERYVMENGPLPIAVACDYVRQAAHGLRHAHERGILHRDIKPSNLLVMDLPPGLEPVPGATYPYGQVKVLDFGLARMYSRRYTEAHVVLGTIDYMAPEQARDARSVDVRADIYSLGGTLYWMLTGKRPFPTDRPVMQELLARQHETPASARNLRPDIPLELESVVCQMMALDPNDRYPTPLAVIAALNQFLEPSRRPESRTVPTLKGRLKADAADSLAAAGVVDPNAGARRVLVISSQKEWRSALRDTLESCGDLLRRGRERRRGARAAEAFPRRRGADRRTFERRNGHGSVPPPAGRGEGSAPKADLADEQRGSGRVGVRRHLRRPGAARHAG